MTAAGPDEAVLSAAGEPEDWGRRGDLLMLAGDRDGADRAYARQLRGLLTSPPLRRASELLIEGRLVEAQQAVARLLAATPDDPATLRLAAELARRLGREAQAEALLARCLRGAPAFPTARYARALALHGLNRSEEALHEAAVLLRSDPGHPICLHIRASALMQTGDFENAAAAYRGVLDQFPNQPLSWVGYGHALKTLGRLDEAVAAYRRSLALRPALGDAWWALANLKVVGFAPADIAAMEFAVAQDTLEDEDRIHLGFALGKALEDLGEYEQAFSHYVAANALARRRLRYDAAETTVQIARSKALLGSAFFTARRPHAPIGPTPIFLVGLPRSGSTLVEQILASHSQVEGTQELPDIPVLARRLGGHARSEAEGAYPDILAAMSPEEFSQLGREYLQRTAVHRKLGRPFFVDKMPNNFAHIGLIHLILPHAKIIDVRRHPLACGFSAFKQHFAQGQAFSYDLEDIGAYYRDYVQLMTHFDHTLPGRVHRVMYENLVAHPEREIRALLAYCGLAFEDGCRSFHSNRRPVRTPSSEQVRRPIFSEAVDHWRRFEPWLGPMKAALGPVLEAYPRGSLA